LSSGHRDVRTTGTEREPIKIFLRRAKLDYAPNHKQGFPHKLAKVT
jgi:hypothetical protein